MVIFPIQGYDSQAPTRIAETFLVFEIGRFMQEIGDTGDGRVEKTNRAVKWPRDLQQQKATATSRLRDKG